MLLAIDIGNSNITFGIFNEKRLEKTFRSTTNKNSDFGLYKKTIEKITKDYKMNITDVVIGSVVPEIDKAFTKAIKSIFGVTPLFINSKVKTNINNFTHEDNELGADRICDIVAAIDKTPGNKIIVDLGTATKFEVISKNNEYLGGAISPGVGDSFKSLLSHASKLPDLKLKKPARAVAGWSTQEHLDSGFVLGFASLIDGMVERIIEERKWKEYSVIITGGFCDLVSPFVKHKHTKDNDLNLLGLKILWEINN